MDSDLTDEERKELEHTSERVLYPIATRQQQLPPADRKAMYDRAMGSGKPFKAIYMPKPPTPDRCRCVGDTVRIVFRICKKAQISRFLRYDATLYPCGNLSQFYISGMPPKIDLE